MTVIYNMSIDRADKPWIGDRRFTELPLPRPVAAEAGPPDPRWRLSCAGCCGPSCDNVPSWRPRINSSCPTSRATVPDSPVVGSLALPG